MNYWLWLGTTLGVGFATFASAVGAIASVLKSASFSKKRGTMILLFISNVSSGMCIDPFRTYFWVVLTFLFQLFLKYSRSYAG